MKRTMNNTRRLLNVLILLLMLGIVLLIYISQLFGCSGAIQGGAVVFCIAELVKSIGQKKPYPKGYGFTS